MGGRQDKRKAAYTRVRNSGIQSTPLETLQPTFQILDGQSIADTDILPPPVKNVRFVSAQSAAPTWPLVALHPPKLLATCLRGVGAQGKIIIDSDRKRYTDLELDVVGLIPIYIWV